MSGPKKPSEADLAAQLRANLRRRKQATRKQASGAKRLDAEPPSTENSSEKSHQKSPPTP